MRPTHTNNPLNPQAFAHPAPGRTSPGRSAGPVFLARREGETNRGFNARRAARAGSWWRGFRASNPGPAVAAPALNRRVRSIPPELRATIPAPAAPVMILPPAPFAPPPVPFDPARGGSGFPGEFSEAPAVDSAPEVIPPPITSEAPAPEVIAPPVFACIVCGREFKTPAAVRGHQRAHKGAATTAEGATDANGNRAAQ